MRCPQCARSDDKVVDSRAAEDGAAIRRRRECLACGRRFTTYERVEELPLTVVKRSGLRQPFDRSKVAGGVLAAAKNRPVGAEAADALAGEVEEYARLEGPEVSSAQLGRAVLVRLRRLDPVAYVRFASVHKDFTDVTDFEREVGLLNLGEPPRAGDR